MPAVTSLSEFNRNQSEVISKLAETAEPLYLTRNGKAAVVVMDAEAFDRAMSFREDVRAREMEVYGGLMRGYQDVKEGRVTDASDAFARIRQKKGW